MERQITFHGDCRTKKNSQRIIKAGKHYRIIPSAAYVLYEKACIRQLNPAEWKEPIGFPINLKCVYYMRTRRKVDLVNLLEATCDILVHAGVLADDNSSIVAGHDGSAVRYDKDNPRVEITIQEVEADA